MSKLRQFLYRISFKFKQIFRVKKSRERNEKVVFIPKVDSHSEKPWETFGADKEEYLRWKPEICGMCCLKMVGDTLDKTRDKSLYQLTMECKEREGFKVFDNGKIEGVFHKPLVRYAEELGIKGEVAYFLNNEMIIESIRQKKFVILSIDLKKVRSDLRGGHLILIHGYNSEEEKFVINDCSNVINKIGQNIKISKEELNNISNKKGILLWD